MYIFFDFVLKKLIQNYYSHRILDLQSNRYFEGLSDKYWNKSANGKCSDSDESEGISIESLGKNTNLPILI